MRWMLHWRGSVKADLLQAALPIAMEDLICCCSVLKWGTPLNMFTANSNSAAQAETSYCKSVARAAV